ncbi:MAG: ferrous iron transport protein B [Verrucomicrobiaceae bacterium]|nr:ferrous iron transport protein B [Verrucomicrobiaceae bacterium]
MSNGALREVEQAASADKSTPLIAIVGNPNSGKTTIFNLLTGLRQKVANYPGVTVEKKEGECFSQHGKKLRLIDLPGAYSLNARSPDEAVLRDVLLGRQAGTRRPDRVICILDSSNLERNLYLATQVLELGLPTVLVLNMLDVAATREWRIDVKAFSEKLGVPVVPMQATSGKGLLELKIAISRDDIPPPHAHMPLPAAIRNDLMNSRDDLATAGAIHPQASLLEPLYLLSDHDPSHYGIDGAQMQRIQSHRQALEKSFPGWEEQLVNDRYAAVEAICKGVLQRPDKEPANLTQKLDRVLLHPIWGGVCLTLVLGALFYFIFSVAEGPMGWIEETFAALGNWIKTWMAPGDLRDLLVDGIVSGVSGVVIFLPQILILFFFIGLMEDTGYMSRIAFIMDRLMSVVGLNGKSFLPLLGSYACAIPGIMATRTIDSPKDRLITILVAPFASCSARLPVYTLLIAAMVPNDQMSAWVKAAFLLGLYALGTFGAFFFAWIFNKSIMRGVASPMILEMPTYKLPGLRSILLQMWQRAKLFLRRAGTVILGLSILIWFASTYPKTSSEDPTERLEHSFAGMAGHLIEPVIRPLGYDWKIGIGLIGSFAAREVFVSTMSVVYAVEAEDDEDLTPLRDRVREEKYPDGRLVFTPLVCLSLLIFYVFAMQCVSTLAIVKRETNSWRWPMFQLGYMTGFAWLLSFIVYQVGSVMGY